MAQEDRTVVIVKQWHVGGFTIAGIFSSLDRAFEAIEKVRPNVEWAESRHDLDNDAYAIRGLGDNSDLSLVEYGVDYGILLT
jgi:hypothetical protein